MENYYTDIGVIVIVAFLGLRGLKNGLILEIMGVIGVVLGIYCASKYCIEGAHYLELAGLKFDNKNVLWMLSFILILAVVWIGSLVVGSIIARFVVVFPEIAIVNYFGGFVFSALKYFVILCVFMYGLMQVGFLKEHIQNITQGSKIYPIMYEVAEKIINTETFSKLQKQYMENDSTQKPKSK